MVHEDRKGQRGRWESRPRKLAGAVEERGYPDPENNVKGAPPSAIVNAGEKGKSKGKEQGEEGKTVK